MLSKAKRGIWSEAARRVLYERYLWKKDGRVVEDPDGMCRRVARAVASAEEGWPASGHAVDEVAEEFYHLLVEQRFMPNSPTLMNAGKDNGMQLSACFVLPVEDSLDKIFETLKAAAVIHQSGGGCIAGDARVWTTFCGIEPIAVLVNRATADGRVGVRQGAGIAYDVRDLNIQTVSMNPATGETCLGRVTHVWRFDVPAEDQVVVSLREGTVIQTSSWHPFMVVRGTRLVEAPAGELAEGDVVLGPDRPDRYWPWTEARTVGALEIDPDLGWLIGFTLGDGSFGYVPALRQHRVRWFSGSRDVLERVQAILALRDIRVSIQQDRRGLLSVATLNQRFVHDLLEACGLEKFGPKDDRIRIPEIIAKSPLPVVRAFLAGLLDSDGGVDGDGSPSYSTASQAMAEDLAALLGLLGYRPSIAEKAPYGRGRRTCYTVLLCPTSQVNQLADDLSPHLSGASGKFAGLCHCHPEPQRRVSPASLVRATSTEHGVADRGDASLQLSMTDGPAPQTVTDLMVAPPNRSQEVFDGLGGHPQTPAGKGRALPGPCQNEGLMRRIAVQGQEVSRVERAATPKPYFDLSVEGWNTYAAGQSGMAMIHNTGFAFSRLRPEGATVRSTQGVASGPVSFMKVYDAATEHVKQGGSRRGANMGILRVDHPDILKFIDCKLTGGITNFNISVAATDRFMEALAGDEAYDLIAPHTGEVVGKLPAKEVFQKIVEAAWQTGDPGMVFVDRANRWTCNPVPELGPLESTNPCGEQWLYGWDACNLGSINVARFVTNRDGRPDVDWAALGTTVRACVRFLDDVIEINPFPIQEITDMVRANRRIGLGIMGWADLLFDLGIPYDSDDALALATRLMEFVTRTGRETSIELARERGPFPNFARSIYKDGPPIRNSTVTTIAPTGTISIISNCSSGIEPMFALAYRHKSGDRTLEFFNPVFEEVGRRRGFLTEAVRQEVLARGTVHDVAGVPSDVQRVFVTAHEIEPEWHVRMQGAFQRHTDNAVSKTINLPNNATADDIAHAYLMAYDAGCLGITVFRDGCKGEQVLNVGLKEGAASAPAPAPVVLRAEIKPRPAVVHGYTRQIQAPEGKVNITVNSDGDGPLEVFINVGRAGSDILALAEAVGRLISLTLRLPSPLSQTERLREVANQLRGIAGSRSVGFGAKQVRSLPDAVAQALDQHLGEAAPAGTNGHSHGGETAAQLTLPLWTGNLCPNCGNNSLVYEEGCKKCHACGYSEC